MNLFYESRGVQIYQGDFREWAQLNWSSPSADLVVADPPYGVTSLWWDDWPTGWPHCADEILKPTGSLWCFGSFKMFLDHYDELAEHFRYSQDAVWEKHNGSNAANDRFRRVHEHAVHFYRGRWDQVYKAPVYSSDAQRRRVHRQKKPAHWNGLPNRVYATEVGGNRLLRSVIYEPSCHGFAINETQKPVAVICPLIEHSCPPGGLVIDAFMGSAAVLEACLRTGRRGIGMDIRPDQCAKAAHRLQRLIL